MRLLECYIEGFGRLQGFRYQFNEGLNVILAENGYGKTTLTAFIKCMLYGMEDTKRQDLAENDRKHYMPWQGGRCGGYLTIERGGSCYKIERYFSTKASEDTFRLYDLDTGLASSDYSSAIGEEMLGIDRDGFERTLFLSERRLSGKNDNKSISAKLSDLVGCDGDVGGMDAAMKKLEEKRKYYKKTGSRGLIDELAAKISICSQDIAAIEHSRDAARGLENTLAEQKESISSLEAKKSALEEERDSLRLKKSKLAISEQYTDGLSRLARDRARMEELREKFGGVVPTAEEIDNASYKLREARALEDRAAQSAEDLGYAALAERFAGKVELAEMERAAEIARELGETAPAEEIPEPRKSKYFSRRVPDKKELEDALSMLKKRGVAAYVVGILLLASAIPLLFIFPYASVAALAIGIVMLIVGGVSASKRRASVEMLLSDLSDEPLPKHSDITEYIKFLTEELEVENRERERIEALAVKQEAILRLHGERRAELVTLLQRIGAPTHDPAAEMLRQREDYLRYYKETIAAEMGETSKQSALAGAARLRREAEETLSRFKGLGNAPFEEIKRMLTEYNYLITSTANRARECAALKEKYGIDSSESGFDPERLVAIESEIRELERDIISKRREYTAFELRIASEAESYERIYELKERLAELEEQKTAAENSLDTVLKTKAYLTAAMTAMTARYLGKTRDGFAKYRRMIEGDTEREFMLDTSFALSVGDVGGTHPEEAYSRGTRDVYALATRLALSDALYDGEPAPIVLDDPFTALDDARLKEALALVEKIAEERQVIYLTCHGSRKPR